MKNFESWNKFKINLESTISEVIFHESEIWWSAIGANLGHEEDGKGDLYERPVLILKKFNENLLIAIPLSTKIKEGRFYVNFLDDKLAYSVLLSQTKVMSSKRLLRKISKLSRGRFSVVKNAYFKLLNT